MVDGIRTSGSAGSASARDEARWSPGATGASPLADQRHTAPAFQAKGGIKVFLFKYVAAFAEAKYTHAFHDGLTTDRFGQSGVIFGNETGLIVNPYESTIRTIHVHAGLSIHFDVKP